MTQLHGRPCAAANVLVGVLFQKYGRCVHDVFGCWLLLVRGPLCTTPLQGCSALGDSQRT